MANGIGRRTESAGNKIRVLYPPTPSGYTMIGKINYTPGATSHTATVLRAIGQTTAASVAAAGVATFTLFADPGPSGNGLAAGDLVAIRETDGVTRLYEVDSYSAGTLVLTTNLIAGVAVSSKVWDFGIESDVNPYTGEVHETYSLPTGSTSSLESVSGLIGSHLPDQPVLLSIDNITNAGVLNYSTSVVSSPGGLILSSADTAQSIGVM